MKISKGLALTIFFMFITAYARSDMDYKEPLTIPYAKEKSDKKSDLTASKNTAKTKAETEVNAGQKAQEQEQIKAQSICIGEDCRGKWPSFKCANYDGRPAGETGDEFCGKMDKTCVAVSIGSGQGFFDECSVTANSVHRCRCCWVE